MRGAVTHLIWNEWDLPDCRAEILLRDAETKLEDMDFDLDEPVEAQVLFLCRRLGYTPEAVDDDEDDDPPSASRTAPRPPGRDPSG